MPDREPDEQQGWQTVGSTPKREVLSDRGSAGRIAELQRAEEERDRLRAEIADAEALARAVSASLTHGEDTPLARALTAYLEKHPWSDL
jgi:hypothetical protein